MRLYGKQGDGHAVYEQENDSQAEYWTRVHSMLTTLARHMGEVIYCGQDESEGVGLVSSSLRKVKLWNSLGKGAIIGEAYAHCSGMYRTRNGKEVANGESKRKRADGPCEKKVVGKRVQMAQASVDRGMAKRRRRTARKSENDVGKRSSENVCR
ncbi:hypothetical protein ACF3MZ_03050 [Paenibacillaceae bacterium WGS1546]|uniref:hypothetical protein n=1 Tax=Cohnella sp. WGS1546 TaxID=3366810 RepID=UPI00372D1A2D